MEIPTWLKKTETSGSFIWKNEPPLSVELLFAGLRFFICRKNDFIFFVSTSVFLLMTKEDSKVNWPSRVQVVSEQLRYWLVMSLLSIKTIISLSSEF